MIRTMSSGAPREEGTPIRYPSTALFCVNTTDGFLREPVSDLIIEGPNPSNLNINPQRTLVSGFMRRLALTEANIQWNIPNVNALNGNLTIDIQSATGVHQFYDRIFLLEAFYSPAEIILQLQSALNFGGGTIGTYFAGLGVTNPFKVYIPDNTGTIPIIEASVPPSPSGTVRTTNNPRIVIELTPAAAAVARFNILPSTASSALTGLPQLRDDLTTMLGLFTTNSGTKSYTSFTGGYASFQYTPYIDILSNTLCKNQTMIDTDTARISIPQKLARIYMSNEAITETVISATYNALGALSGTDDNVIGTAPFVFRREFAFPKQIAWNDRQNIDFLQLQIVDARGNAVPINFRSKDIPLFPENHTTPDIAAYQFTLQVSEI